MRIINHLCNIFSQINFINSQKKIKLKYSIYSICRNYTGSICRFPHCISSQHLVTTNLYVLHANSNKPFLSDKYNWAYRTLYKFKIKSFQCKTTKIPLITKTHQPTMLKEWKLSSSHNSCNDWNTWNLESPNDFESSWCWLIVDCPLENHVYSKAMFFYFNELICSIWAWGLHNW